uniref:Uncharacterized protein n=1 Tax=Oryza barthii TaxID=65489 RepID=A0A0D3FU11_9ORYZ
MPSPAGGRGGRAAATESRRDDRESLDRSRARGLHYPHLPPLLLRPPFFLSPTCFLLFLFLFPPEDNLIGIHGGQQQLEGDSRRGGEVDGVPHLRRRRRHRRLGDRRRGCA